MHLTRIKVANVKGVRYVDVTPNKTCTVIGGMNAQGKSSLLDAIAMTLGGKALCPEEPIRTGETQAVAEVELDGDAERMIPPCTVTRTWWRKSPTKIETELKIVTKDGYEAPTPQTLLNDIVGSLGFDPESFIRAKPAEQAEILKRLVGLDFTELDREHDRVYSERTGVNSQGKAMKARAEGMPTYPNVPLEEESVTEIAAQVAAATAKVTDNQQRRNALDEMVRLNDRRRDTASKIDDEIARLEKQLEAARKEKANAILTIEEANVAIETERKAVESLVDPDVKTLVDRISLCDKINSQIRANRAKLAVEEELQALRESSEAMTKRLREIEAEKERLTSEAKWPIAGLGYDDKGVLFNGRPFDQASTMEKLEIAVAINAALNPTLKFMFLRHGAMLDDQQKIATAKLAAERGFQLFLEVVGEGEACDIVMADGEMKPSDDESLYVLHALDEIANASTIEDLDAMKLVFAAKSDAVKAKLRKPFGERYSEIQNGVTTNATANA